MADTTEEEVKVHDCKRKIGRCSCYRPRWYLGRDATAHTVAARHGVFHLVAMRYFGVSCFASTRDGIRTVQWDNCNTWKEVFMKKREPSNAAKAGVLHLAAVESDLFSKHLPIVQHCSHTMYDDGSVRKPGWITIKTMGSTWVVEVKDPDSCSRMTVVQQTLDDALTMASVLLESEEAPWENDPWLKKQPGGKKAA